MSIEIHDKASKTYIVLGAPNGGTSFIAKALHDQGIDMGIDDTEFYENLEFTNLIKGYIGGQKREHVDEDIEKLITKYRKDKWGYKATRGVYLARKVLRLLPKDDDVYLVCIFRKPSRIKRGPGGSLKYYRYIISVIRKFINDTYYPYNDLYR